MNKYEIKLNETEYVTVVFDTSIEPGITVLRLQRVHRKNKEFYLLKNKPCSGNFILLLQAKINNKEGKKLC